MAFPSFRASMGRDEGEGVYMAPPMRRPSVPVGLLQDAPGPRTADEALAEMLQPYAPKAPRFGSSQPELPIPTGPALPQPSLTPQQPFDYMAALERVEPPAPRPEGPKRRTLGQVSPLAQLLAGAADVVGAMGGHSPGYLGQTQNRQQSLLDTEFADALGQAAMKWQDEERRREHLRGLIREQAGASARAEDLAYRGRGEKFRDEQAEQGIRERARAHDLQKRRFEADEQWRAFESELIKWRLGILTPEAQEAEAKRKLADRVAAARRAEHERSLSMVGTLSDAVGIEPPSVGDVVKGGIYLTPWAPYAAALDLPGALIPGGAAPGDFNVLRKILGTMPPSKAEQARQQQEEHQRLLELARSGRLPADWRPGMPIPGR